MPIDKDPAVAALLEEWIRGEIDMKTMRDCYLDVLALKDAERRGGFARRKERSFPDAT